MLSAIFYCCDSKQKNSLTLGTEEIYSEFDPNIFIGKHKAKAMILGVFHFSNPGLDSYKEKYTVDILSDKRQAEIKVLLDKLKEFKPTKILIEGLRIEYDSIYNSMYNNYLKGEFDISNRRNENYQLGFRLAKELGHDRIYASDVKSGRWIGEKIDWDNYDADTYTKSLGQYKKANRYDYNKGSMLSDSLKTVRTLTQYLYMENQPSHSLKSHQQYLTMTIEGAGDLFIGADSVARWYKRNIRISANVYDITDFDKEDRILMIYGAGHVWQLRQFFTDSPDFDYVEVNDYLGK